ncbi:MAG: HutD/Ves family protein [Massilia sp.]|jgi:environmental stress-induced protein Ves|nr:HutD/Ves family protein [Massilia sp.]MDB5952066.1 HutD/Ves family protein [Massilia sp.]
MTMLIAFASLAPVPWKNGGGTTTEIIAEPPGAQFHDFDWRISLATILQDGPFSVFPGVDRTLALVEGPGLVLDIDDSRFALDEMDAVIEFAGESAVRASLDGGPTIDFNVMTRRAVCHHKFGRRRLEGTSVFAPRGDRSLLFLAEGESLSVSSDDERIGLVRFDAIVFDTDTVWTLEAQSATVFIVDLFYGSPAL